MTSKEEILIAAFCSNIIRPTERFTKKIDFDGVHKDLIPYGSLFQASNGKLYGTTELGVAGFGGLFEYDIIIGQPFNGSNI